MSFDMWLDFEEDCNRSRKMPAIILGAVILGLLIGIGVLVISFLGGWL